MQDCEDPGCLKACPSPGAIVKYTNGIVDFIEENCIGCGNCVTGCPFDIPRISKKSGKVYKCTLCSDRVAVGLEPACIKACPTGCLQFGTRGNLLDIAEKRVEQLKSQGFKNAAATTPGVGGTNVITIPYGDRPELYGGLPKNPKIPAYVGLMKSVAKPVGNAHAARRWAPFGTSALRQAWTPSGELHGYCCSGRSPHRTGRRH